MFSLGGLDENGKNMFVIEVDKNIFVFEAGLKYADELTLGIDYIIPNITYLKENKMYRWTAKENVQLITKNLILETE